MKNAKRIITSRNFLPVYVFIVDMLVGINIQIFRDYQSEEKYENITKFH